jgi:4-hydroxy-tetrahydrodipicolinate synthase
MEKKFHGIYTIPPVVYYPNYEVDYESTRRCVKFCLDCGAHGIVLPVYATEYFVLTDEERKKILEVAIQEANGKVPVVAGVSSAYVKNAVDLAKHACSVGAASVLAAPPHVMKVSQEEMYDYYKQINDNVDVPVFLQHFFPPLGAPMSAEFMIRMCNELEYVKYIKEESLQSNLMITRLREVEKANPKGNLWGIMGGKGARALFEEYDRGICGTMPPSQFTDVIVDIWNLLEQGERQKAFELHTQALPALVYGGTYPIISYKHILKRRGVVNFAGCRPAGWPQMDDYSFRDLDLIMENIKPLLRVNY